MVAFCKALLSDIVYTTNQNTLHNQVPYYYIMYCLYAMREYSWND